MDAPGEGGMTSNSFFSLTPQRTPSAGGQQQQGDARTSSLSQPDAPRKAGGAPASTTSAVGQFDAETMQTQLELFVSDGLYDSAQVLGEFLIALANAAATGAGASSAGADGAPLSHAFHGKTFRLFADLLVAKREYKRALVSGGHWPYPYAWEIVG
jgi:hypothetical protein